MSFVITLYVREGIVMAADSRLSLERADPQPDPNAVVRHLITGQTDTGQKLFLAPNGAGIALTGSASVSGVPLADHMRAFLATPLPDPGCIDATARQLLAFLKDRGAQLPTSLFVAGYATVAGMPQQQVWAADSATGACELRNGSGKPGATWGGEVDIVARLVQPVAQVDCAGNVVAQLPHHDIEWGLFTLQDAIDFAVFAARCTAGIMQFQSRPKTVGGPIDVLVLKPGGAEWIQRKALHGESPRL